MSVRVPPTAAFFDVDGTLTNVTGMARFLAYRFTAEGRPQSDYREEVRRLRAMSAAGASRFETNRSYFSSYAGLDAARVAALGEAWFLAELRQGGFFNTAAVAALRRHAGAGHLVVLVSGSFPACLEPLARHLSADLVVCSRPAIENGRYTGELDIPMIGPEKSEAVRELMSRRGILSDHCWAYGDHSSDLPLLDSVGHPVVVGDDPVMTEVAEQRGWQRLPAEPVVSRTPQPQP